MSERISSVTGRLVLVMVALSLAAVAPCLANELELQTSGFRASEAEEFPNGVRLHRVTSPWQAGETQIRVLKPDSRPAAGADQKPLRLLLVLPVEAGTASHYGDGLAEIGKQNLHNRLQLVCVAPTFSHLPWYADPPTDPTIQQETYLLKGVIPFVSKTYNAGITADDRLLIGFSKSGWGAFSLLLRHPDVFGKAVAWDAPLMMSASGPYGSGPIFGTQENFAHYRVSELLKTAGKQLGPKIRLIHIGYGNFKKQHTEFESLLNELDIPHVYQHGPERPHAWGSGWFGDAVRLLDAN